MRIDPAAIAVAASTGKSRLRVFKKPHVAFSPPGTRSFSLPLGPAGIRFATPTPTRWPHKFPLREANLTLLPVAPDETVRLRELILRGLQFDLLLLSGGVSMGKYDLVEQVLSELGAQFLFTSVAIQPGKPTVFGNIKCGADTAVQSGHEHKYFFGLPGNPVSTMVTFDLFAKPIIEALAGMHPRKLVFLRLN